MQIWVFFFIIFITEKFPSDQRKWSAIMDGARRRVVSGLMMNIEYEWLMDLKEKLFSIKSTAVSSHTHLSHERKIQRDGSLGWPRDENTFSCVIKFHPKGAQGRPENEASFTYFHWSELEAPNQPQNGKKQVFEKQVKTSFFLMLSRSSHSFFNKSILFISCLLLGAIQQLWSQNFSTFISFTDYWKFPTVISNVFKFMNEPHSDIAKTFPASIKLKLWQQEKWIKNKNLIVQWKSLITALSATCRCAIILNNQPDKKQWKSLQFMWLKLFLWLFVVLSPTRPLKPSGSV